MKVLIDTNIVLDIALKREPYYLYSSKVFNIIDNYLVTGYVTATTITDIYDIAKKEKGHTLAIEFIKNLIEILNVIDINKDIILKSLSSELNDFEDAIQSEASLANSIDLIITRNIKDFVKSEVKAINPLNFISLFDKN